MKEIWIWTVGMKICYNWDYMLHNMSNEAELNLLSSTDKISVTGWQSQACVLPPLKKCQIWEVQQNSSFLYVQPPRSHTQVILIVAGLMLIFPGCWWRGTIAAGLFTILEACVCIPLILFFEHKCAHACEDIQFFKCLANFTSITMYVGNTDTWM